MQTRLLCAVLGASVLALASCRATPPPSGPAQPATPAAAAPAATTLTPAQIAARSTPAVVSIRSTDSLGTGFVVRKDGWIATNLHVIAGERDLVVATSDKREFPVLEVLAADDARDLALVRVDARDLPVLALGDSDAVRAGDAVVAIGHPLGLEDTVSNGLVSAVRVLDPALTVLQISAPIAPGSSGGPIFSDRGEVIGVATFFSTEGQNLNFGVPVRYLKTLLGDTHPVPIQAFAAATAEHSDPALPSVKREVPAHDLKLLEGCSDAELEKAVSLIGEAIEVGAPVYNEHHFAACYHIYDGAGAEVEKKLGAGCKGPKKAMRDGRAKAQKLTDPAAQAWAMRDAFDGLLDVIERRFQARKRR
ncbi:HtrA protease/chaperone protein [Minicystis rosea]|nr:HtrA protease/chaperone protein [Minicystis rosea]